MLVDTCYLAPPCAVGRVFPLLDLKPKIDCSGETGLQPDPVIGALAFSHVSFV